MVDLSSLPKEKQRLVTIGLIVVIAGIVGYLLYANVFAGSGGDQAAPAAGPDATAMPPVMPPTAGGPGMPPPGGGPGQPTPGPGAAQPPPMAPPMAPPSAPGAPPAAQPVPQPAPQAAPTTPATAPPPQPAPAKSGPNTGPKTITVFGSVTVTYPKGWGVGMGTGSTAVISDGKGRFEVHSPDAKATDAKSIAAKAVTSITGRAPGSLPQGELKISGYNAYYYMVGDKRIVGIDAPTRIVLVEYAKGAPFSAYSAAFDKMQSDLKFR